MIAQSWVSFALNRRSFSLRLLFSLTVLLGLLMAIDIGYERRENHRLQTYKSLEQKYPHSHFLYKEEIRRSLFRPWIARKSVSLAGVYVYEKDAYECLEDLFNNVAISDVRTISVYERNEPSDGERYRRVIRSIFGIPRLTSLAISFVPLEIDCAHGIADLPLTQLTLNDPSIDDEFLEVIASCKTLEELNVQFTSVSDDALVIFERLPRLWLLSCDDSKITDTAIREFAARNPQITVSHLTQSPFSSNLSN